MRWNAENNLRFLNSPYLYNPPTSSPQPSNEDKPNERAKDYNSKDGMQSAIFGPAFWMTIHITSFNYPSEPTEEDKQNYKTWLLSLEKILPCKYCRQNFPQNLKTAGFSDAVFADRATFSRFCYDLHCCVNTMLKKTSPSFEEVRDTYEALRAKCLSEDQKEKLQKQNKELGCIRPNHKGKRGKCVINIVPVEFKVPNNIRIHDQCMPNE